MSELPPEADSPISVVRDVALEFMNAMLQERIAIEQQIKEKVEEIRSQFIQLGQSTFSFADVDNLIRQYKEFFVQFYKNTIHTRLVTYATRTIKEGIHQGYVKMDIVKEEIFAEFRELQEVASAKGELDLRSEEMEKTLLEQTETFSDIQSENLRLQNELQVSQQLVSEKEAELENLAASMMQMENQLNIIGRQLMETNAELDDTRDLYARKEAEVLKLKSELARKEELEQEIETLRGRVQELTRRETELLASQSTTSSEFLDQLQEELEKTRNELFELKSERVEKNEELRRIKLELEEKVLQLKHLTQYKEKADADMAQLNEQVRTLTEEKEKLSTDYNTAKEKLERLNTEIKEKAEIIAKYEEELRVKDEKLKEYEGKITLSSEVKEGYEKTLDYFKRILKYDPKFRVLTIIDSMDAEIQMEDLAISLGIPVEILHRSLVELADAGYITIRRDGKLLFARTVDSRRAPFSLENALSA